MTLHSILNPEIKKVLRRSERTSLHYDRYSYHHNIKFSYSKSIHLSTRILCLLFFAMYDAIVVGLGGVGSMALRGLARQERSGKFLGIEAYTLLHPHGSSHGKTRIYRRAYFEHPNYVPWIDQSIRVFREMENEHDDSFIQECGTVIIEQSQNPTSSDPAHFPKYCQASYQSAKRHKIPVEFLNSSALKDRLPQFRLEPHNKDMVGLLEPSGGFVRCQKVMAAALREAKQASHVEIMEQTRVMSLGCIPSDKGGKCTIELRVQTANEKEPVVLTTKCLLVSAGAWTGQIFPSWAPYLRPSRQFAAWIPVERKPELYSYQKMPTFVILPPKYHLPLYGFPFDDDDEDGFHKQIKIGIHGRDDFISNPSANPKQVSAIEQSEFLHAVQHAFDFDQLHQRGEDSSLITPDHAFTEIQTCMYTMTPDTHFMLGTPAGHDQIFCVAGLSGHGYKQAPALGQMMVDYALGNDMSHWKLDFCDPKRFCV